MVNTSLKNANPNGNVILLLGRDAEDFPMEITRVREIWPGRSGFSGQMQEYHRPAADGCEHHYYLIPYCKDNCQLLEMWRFEYRGDREIEFVDADAEDLDNAVIVFQAYLRPAGKAWSRPDADEEDFLRLTFGVTRLDKEYYKEAASFGDTGAMRELAALHMENYDKDGDEKSARKCLKWYRKAAELGDIEAMYKLSRLYAEEKGVRQSDKDVLRLKPQYSRHYWELRWNEKMAWQWMLQAYETAPGNPETSFLIAIMYAYGWCVYLDSAKARQWYEKAAKLGHTKAMHNLGVMYKAGRWRVNGFGRGIARDCVKAEEWLLKAVEQGGHARSIDVLLELRNLGKDYKQKLAWYKRAAEQGNAESMFALAEVYKKGEGTSQNYEQAMAWYRKAAQRGYEGAAKALGIMYDQGLGVQQSYKKAVLWFRIGAARDKDEESQRILRFYGEEQLGKADELRIISYAEWEAAAREQYIKEHTRLVGPERKATEETIKEATEETDSYFKKDYAAEEIRKTYDYFVSDLKTGKRHLSSLPARICSLTECLDLMYEG